MVEEVVWAPLDAPGLEHLRLVGEDGPLQAHSTVLGLKDGRPFTLTYLVRWDLRWHARSLRCDCRTGDRLLTLDLEADGEGRWRKAGRPLSPLQGCLDVDIAVTPFTNTLPIRRLALPAGDAAEISVVYVDVPALTVEPMRQRYTRLADDVYRYESVVSGFRADLRVDPDGLVIEYPHSWRRILPP